MKFTVNRTNPEDMEAAVRELTERGFKQRGGIAKKYVSGRIYQKNKDEFYEPVDIFDSSSYVAEFEAVGEKPENITDPAHYYKMLALKFQNKLHERVKEVEELEEEVKRLCGVAADLREEAMRKDDYIKLLERNQNSGVKIIEKGGNKLYEGSFFWKGRSIHIGEFESRKGAVQAVKEAKKNICL